MMIATEFTNKASIIYNDVPKSDLLNKSVLDNSTKRLKQCKVVFNYNNSYFNVRLQVRKGGTNICEYVFFRDEITTSTV